MLCAVAILGSLGTQAHLDLLILSLLRLTYVEANDPRYVEVVQFNPVNTVLCDDLQFELNGEADPADSSEVLIQDLPPRGRSAHDLTAQPD